MVSTIQKFTGWVAVGCLHICMTWSLKLNYFYKWRWSFLQLCDHEWTFNFAFCIGITQHTNEQNTTLQEWTHSISEMLDNIIVFERKLQLWKLQLQSSNVCSSQFWEQKIPLMLRICSRNSVPSIRIQLPFSKHAQVWGHNQHIFNVILH
jgi:hypothetical protein